MDVTTAPIDLSGESHNGYARVERDGLRSY